MPTILNCSVSDSNGHKDRDGSDGGEEDDEEQRMGGSILDCEGSLVKSHLRGYSIEEPPQWWAICPKP